jgi:anti-sigma factor RsiW
MMTSQDFDRLSAYIDDELTPAEKAALEARLAAEPELRDTLRDLRLTVRALRALPPVKPPRSFTLTPAQAGLAGRAQPRRSLFPTLRLAAAFSALMLTVVIAGDLGSGVLATRTALNTGAAEEAATELVQMPAAAPLPSETAAEPDVESLAVESAEATGGVGSDAATPEETQMVSSLLAPEETPTPDTFGERQVSPTVGPTDKQGPEATPTPVTVAEAPPDETLLYATGTQAASDTAVTQPPRGLSALRTIELGLAMLTVLLGLGAWLARRNA